MGLVLEIGHVNGIKQSGLIISDSLLFWAFTSIAVISVVAFIMVGGVGLSKFCVIQ